MKLFLEYFSSLVQYSNILPVFVLQFFLFCIIVSNVGKKTKTTQKKKNFLKYTECYGFWNLWKQI